jgi:DNA-binding HxlR family transcriptional regulator
MSNASRTLAVEGFHHITAILKCKWTLAILDAVRRGVTRPSHIQRDLPGLTPKVLNERIKKLERFGVLEKTVYPEIPPRVEYRLTDRGKKLIQLLEQISEFIEREWSDVVLD